MRRKYSLTKMNLSNTPDKDTYNKMNIVFGRRNDRTKQSYSNLQTRCYKKCYGKQNKKKTTNVTRKKTTNPSENFYLKLAKKMIGF